MFGAISKTEIYKKGENTMTQAIVFSFLIAMIVYEVYKLIEEHMYTLNVQLAEGAIFESKNKRDTGHDVCAVNFGLFIEGKDGKKSFESNNVDEITLNTNDKIVIDTGVSAEWCMGFVRKKVVIDTQMRGRSSLNSEALLLQFGSIDEKYRNRIYATLINVGHEPIKIKKYERIAQVVISQAIKPTIRKANYINTKTERGLKGHGSTGKT